MQLNRIPSHLTLFIFTILSIVAQPVAYTQIPPAQRNLTIDDFFKIKRVSDPQISPEGKWVAYTVRDVDLKEDKYETHIWMVPTSGGEAIPMTAKDYSAKRPRWSPDGKFLSFLAKRKEGDKTQVWTLNRQGGEAQQLTKIAQGVSSYEWSPNGKKLLLILKDPKPEDLIKDKKGKKKPKPWVIDRLQFKHDGDGYLDNYRDHLYVLVPGDTIPTQITSGNFDDSDPAWSPDGKLIAFVSNRTENSDGNSNTDIWVVSADNTDKGQTLIQVTTNLGSDDRPAWSPDGEWITYTTVIQPEIIWYATTHLAVIPSGGGEARLLTQELDRHVSSPRFSADGQSVYFLLEDSGEQHLARIELSTGHISRPVSGQRSVRSFRLGPEGAIALLNSQVHLPTEVFMLKQGELSQLTHTNDKFLSGIELGRVEEVRFESRDGTEIEAFITFPPDFNERLSYPTLLWPHGGPVSQEDFGWDFESQLFAANGYLVLRPNPRGSSGYGQEFSMEIWQAWGVKDFEDEMAAVDYAIQKGYADPDRMGVGGWSYGGIMTNYVITQTDRFKAAISGSSEVLYVSCYGHDQWQLQWELELGLPWKNRELWDKISPFNQVEKIVTPTLIMCGEKDWTDPVLNSEQLYQALKRLGRTTQLVVYPGEDHGISRPSFQKDRYQRYLDWFNKYVMGETSEKSR